MKTALLIGLALALSACADEPFSRPDSPQTPSPASDGEPTPQLEPSDSLSTPRRPALVPTTEPPVVGDLPEDLVAAIKADLKTRTGAQPEAMTIVRAEAMTWSDSSLGCPKPNVDYLQVLTDGYWIVLRVDDTEYDYRASTQGNFFLCELPFPRELGTPSRIIRP